MFLLNLSSLNLLLFLFCSGENHGKTYWVGKDSLKSWRRMYLELFEYFVNNHDIPPNTALPLNPDLLSVACDPSSSFVEDKKFFKSKDRSRFIKMDGITLEAIDGCRKLAHLFVNNSISIFKILNVETDFKPFHYSLLELESVLEEMTNILSSVIAKKVNDELANEELKYDSTKMDGSKIIKSESSVPIESESKTDDEHKDDDVEDNSHEEKDKHDDSDSFDNKNDTEYMSWGFNEDITCPHGRLIIQNFYSMFMGAHR